MFRSNAVMALLVSGLMGAVGCATEDADPGAAAAAPEATASTVPMTARVAAIQTFKQAAAQRTAAVLADPAVRDQLLATVRARGSVAVAELPALADELRALGAAALVAAPDAVPEVSLREPAGGGDRSRLLIAYAPAGNERSWTSIPAYTLDGQRLELDVKRAPDVPVLVIDALGKLASQQGVAAANLALQRAGLQAAPTAPVASALAPAAAARWTTRLDSIRLSDDEEPWISGAAEIYAIVSGVVDNNGAAVKIVDMPYLDYDGTTYTPHQIILDWNDYAYQAANIELYEKDDNTSYQSLVEALITAIGAGGSLAGYPEVEAITDIANRIVAAMPSSWFANDDDYVDSYYTIDKTTTYTNYRGAHNNATVTLTPYLLQPN